MCIPDAVAQRATLLCLRGLTASDAIELYPTAPPEANIIQQAGAATL
jgi:hypothetical protein